MIDWHHLFGWTLVDFFTDTNYQVELEKDLSVKPQLVDVVIIEKSLGSQPSELPDGLENLSQHNLLSYKSLRETLDTLVIAELLSYYVNYRKLLNPKQWNKLPLEDFQLYAITTRYPREFAKTFKDNLQSVKKGVYDLQFGKQIIRIIVLSQVPATEKNALWQLFSSKADDFEFGIKHYQWRYPAAIALLKPLFHKYKKEVNMSYPYTFEEACKIFSQEILDEMPAAERLKGLSAAERVKGLLAAERVKGLPAAEKLKGLPAAERLKGLPAAERVKGLPAAERLKGLSLAEIEAYLAKQKKG